MATQKEILQRLNRAAQAIEKGNNLAAAQVQPVNQQHQHQPVFNGGQAPAVVKTGDNFAAKKRTQYDGNPLAQSFINLGEINPAFKHLWDDEVLSNPHGFLRKKQTGRTGREEYVVKNKDLERMIQTLLYAGAGRQGMGFMEWTGKGYDAIATGLQKGAMNNAFGQNGQAVTKAISYQTTASSGTPATGGGVLIRTDLEPLVREAYLRSFPAAEAIGTVPANGLVHSYNTRTTPGTAGTVSEVADISSVSAAVAASTYQRNANSNIAIIAAQRGISLKAQYAIAQSGMGYDLSGQDGLEAVGAIYAIAQKNQSLMLQGNYSTGSKTKDDEEGATDTNGYDGYRTLLKSYGLTKGSTQSYRDAIDQAVGQIMNAGGNSEDLMLFASVGAKRAVNGELQQFLRRNDQNDGPFPLNMAANGFTTVSDWPAQFVTVPASAQTDAMGYYTISSVVYEDITVVDPNESAFAYLGSPSPVILELPLGYNNVLANVYIIFLMNGLVVYIPNFNRKVRIPQQTV